MRLLYFASMRQRIGCAEETVNPPAEVATVADLVGWLRGRGPAYAAALADDRAVKVAVNHAFARSGDPVAPGDEVALFPPVTGG